MRIAVIGSGVSGLCAAYGLRDHHDVTLFEADHRVGGHVNTVPVTLPDRRLDVDTGFIVFNRRTYPLFSALLDRLGVVTQPTEMSFSVSTAGSDYEFRGDGLGPWVQLRNVADPAHARMLYEIVRFNRLARTIAADSSEEETLAAFLRRHRFSRRFTDRYVVPLGSAIWSADPTTFAAMPARTFSRFMDNHGMLAMKGRPQWYTVTGGARSYVEALTTRLGRRVRTCCAIHKVVRSQNSVTLLSDDGPETFDAVVIAVHSDDALRLLSDPTRAELEILGSVRYQPSVATLHTDRAMLPRRRSAWAAWNAHIPEVPRPDPTVTYWMNRLQGLVSPEPLCVTLNRADEIDATRVLGQWCYAHPIFDSRALAAQCRRDEIQGRRRTWYCGAYWGYGFHEDGVRSARDVCRRLGSPW